MRRIHIFRFSESEIFVRGELTSQIRLNQLAKLDFARTRFGVVCGRVRGMNATESIKLICPSGKMVFHTLPSCHPHTGHPVRRGFSVSYRCFGAIDELGQIVSAKKSRLGPRRLSADLIKTYPRPPCLDTNRQTCLSITVGELS